MEWLDTFWSTYSTLVLTVGTNILLALSIYLTLACGLLTVANAAFMGIGAYTVGSADVAHADLPFLLVLSCGALLPALVALVIGQPTLRLSGVYLAMATLAFGEVVRIVFSIPRRSPAARLDSMVSRNARAASTLRWPLGLRFTCCGA